MSADETTLDGHGWGQGPGESDFEVPCKEHGIGVKADPPGSGATAAECCRCAQEAHAKRGQRREDVVTADPKTSFLLKKP